jgi:hypothetical protein
MTTSYANNGGTGDRRPEIVVSTNILSAATDGGAGASYDPYKLYVWLDGNTAGSIGTTAREFGNANNGLDRNITFDFGAGASIVIDELKAYISGTTSFGSWTIDGSNDGSSWTTLASSFTLQPSGGSFTKSFTNSTGYRYYRLHTTSFQNGGGGSGGWSEFEFKLEDITPQGSRCSWYNSGGKGNRSAFITPSTTLSLTSGSIGNVIDGDYTNNSTHAISLTSGQSAKEIKFDFGSGASIVIDTVVLWFDVTSVNTHGTWKLQGSNDNSSWTDIGSTFSLNDSNNLTTFAKHTVTNTTGYRYYRLLQTAGTTNVSPNITEIEFRISGLSSLAKVYKASGYGIISPIDAHVYKASGYAILYAPGVGGNKQPVIIVATGD